MNMNIASPWSPSGDFAALATGAAGGGGDDAIGGAADWSVEDVGGVKAVAGVGLHMHTAQRSLQGCAGHLPVADVCTCRYAHAGEPLTWNSSTKDH